MNLNSNNLKSALAERVASLLKEQEHTERDLADLVNSYYELSHFRMAQSRSVADRILKLLGGRGEGTGLNDSQMVYLFQGLALRNDLSSS